jgi:DNA-binding NtrC family response regulator
VQGIALASPIALPSLGPDLAPGRATAYHAYGERSLDVKLIAASQAELGGLVRQGRFRGDLYQRLAVVLLDTPPLRDRGEDVVLPAQQ